MPRKQSSGPVNVQLGEQVTWRGFLLKVVDIRADGMIELMGEGVRVQISDTSEVMKEPDLNGN